MIIVQIFQQSIIILIFTRKREKLGINSFIYKLELDSRIRHEIF